MVKKLLLFFLNFLGYGIHRITEQRRDIKPAPRHYGIPDEQFYSPLFSPWKGYGSFPKYYTLAKPYTLVSPDRCYILLTLARQAATLKGVWVECGVYKGGTAMMLAKLIHESSISTTLHLFDTFKGMPETDPAVDIHKEGDFSDLIFEEVKDRIVAVCSGGMAVAFHRGYIPDTFNNCNIERISFAHIDVDIFKSVNDCCSFIYPRLVPGGILIFDDYGFPTCPGARRAVDYYFAEKPEVPLVLPSGQALVIKV